MFKFKYPADHMPVGMNVGRRAHLHTNESQLVLSDALRAHLPEQEVIFGFLGESIIASDCRRGDPASLCNQGASVVPATELIFNESGELV